MGRKTIEHLKRIKAGRSDRRRDSMNKKYEWKARGGSRGIVEADNLLDLIKQVNLGLMNELGYSLNEFTSIEEMETKTIKEKDNEE